MMGIKGQLKYMTMQGERQKRNIFGAALNIANILGVSPFNPPLLPSINLVGVNLSG